jgi:hypothetical protein
MAGEIDGTAAACFPEVIVEERPVDRDAAAVELPVALRVVHRTARPEAFEDVFQRNSPRL